MPKAVEEFASLAFINLQNRKKWKSVQLFHVELSDQSSDFRPNFSRIRKIDLQLVLEAFSFS